MSLKYEQWLAFWEVGVSCAVPLESSATTNHGGGSLDEVLHFVKVQKTWSKSALGDATWPSSAHLPLSLTLAEHVKK